GRPVPAQLRFEASSAAFHALPACVAAAQALPVRRPQRRNSCLALRCDNMSHKLARFYCVRSLPMGFVQVQQRLKLAR
ncbi:hypothetical protein, partial [Xanthomonas perforans]|uniref:hypothetical protein n=1 Tax=Xanthomonas perforans TaxID=442694 RepID=UPI001F464938